AAGRARRRPRVPPRRGGGGGRPPRGGGRCRLLGLRGGGRPRPRGGGGGRPPRLRGAPRLRERRRPLRRGDRPRDRRRAGQLPAGVHPHRLNQCRPGARGVRRRWGNGRQREAAMNRSSTILWGFVATVFLTGIMAGSQGLGLTRMNIPFMLGTMFPPNRDRAKLIGFVAHLLNGWAFATAYAAAFESWRRATWWLGAAIGLVH